MGVEAYVFHDRFESYVCVGSFEWIKKNNQQNPQVVKLINSYKANVRGFARNPWRCKTSGFALAEKIRHCL